jgi:hypothetical protein
VVAVSLALELGSELEDKLKPEPAPGVITTGEKLC